MRSKWNRVTPLSKTLAAIVFVALPFLGFYLGVQYGLLRAAVDQATSATAGVPTAAVSEERIGWVEYDNKIQDQEPHRIVLAYPSIGTVVATTTFDGGVLLYDPGDFSAVSVRIFDKKGSWPLDAGAAAIWQRALDGGNFTEAYCVMGYFDLVVPGTSFSYDCRDHLNPADDARVKMSLGKPYALTIGVQDTPALGARMAVDAKENTLYYDFYLVDLGAHYAVIGAAEGSTVGASCPADAYSDWWCTHLGDYLAGILNKIVLPGRSL